MERNGLTGKVTIEVDLENFGEDLDYPFKDMLMDEVTSYIRAHIRENILKQHKRYLNKWTEDYLAGKHPVDQDGAVMLAIPIDLLRS